MVHGTHVTESDCERMTELYATTLVSEIADRFDVSTVTVRYHVNGRCAHETGPKPRRTGQRGADDV